MSANAAAAGGARCLAAAALLLAAGCSPDDRRPTLTFSGSGVGREADVLRQQFARFEAANPPFAVRLRVTPDGANERRQLYVHWLNARASDPDVLQIDTIWTAEFAAAGWIQALDRFGPDVGGFFPAVIAANVWDGRLYALPWFVDVGMLYWRTDLMPAPPATFEALIQVSRQARDTGATESGFVWQGARYEGLVTVFLEHLGGFGGRILDDTGGVVVDSDAAVAALTFMRDSIWASGAVPPSVLTWQEEQTRFAFQNGQAAFMRNWPYAYGLVQDAAGSRVAGHVGIAAMPATPAGAPTAALGGSHLAVNTRSEHADAAFALIAFLTAPEQMLERARVAGQFPARPALYESAELSEALGFDASAAQAIVERALPRPVTPVYSELSEILQVGLHRALTRQEEPRAALQEAARAMRRAITRAGLDAERPGA